jgi:hypothetical protein
MSQTRFLCANPIQLGETLPPIVIKCYFFK